MTDSVLPNSTRDARRTTVFISYHRETASAFADQLMADLQAAAHRCWVDTVAIKGGEEWIKAIVAGLNQAAALVVLVNNAALQSHWVRKEILFAIKKQKLIIPLYLEANLNDDEAFLLVDCQGISFIEHEIEHEYDKALAALLRALPKPLTPQAATLNHARELELAYLDRLTLEELVNTDKYTPLGGASQQQARRAEMRAVFELMPLRVGKTVHEPAAPRQFENAVAEILELRRAVLLGEPGGGKTTTIWKLAADLAERARLAAHEPIPLLIRLGRWTDAKQTLPDFIATQLGELGGCLASLLKDRRAALLLDGLNELPASQHKDKYPLVQKFIASHPQLLAIVSCRALDYTIELNFDRINITPLDPLRIREFVGRYLGEEQGEALFWKLAGEEAKQQLAKFLNKFADKFDQPERVFWIADQLPAGHYWGYDWRDDERKDNTYWQNWLKLRELPSSLMVLARNPYMLLMLTSVYAQEQALPDNRGELFRLFVEILLQREKIPDEEQEPLTAGLARVAYEMQMRRAASAQNDQDGGALTVLPKTAVLKLLSDHQLYLAGCANLLSVGDEVRFSHQLLQEYFAAKYMDIEIKAGRLAAASIWQPGKWWERTNWEEAAILLAGLYSDDCTPVVEWLADAQPETAAQCINRSGAALAETTRARLRAKWLPRLTDLRGEPEAQARAALGRALGQTGLDNRPGVGLNRDGLPDFAWVEIPAGEFQYGDDKAEYAAKPQRITLPTFSISRYPVTYAQFQAFLDDAQGYGAGRWWAGLAADEDERQPGEQAFKFANHPRETVNWYEAMAFCRWLSWRWGGGFDLQRVDKWVVRLPTEFEWEKAARGTDGRLYPYKGKYDTKKSNTVSTIGQTSAVGIFPNGASPYGVEELSGNVWEWCLSAYDKPQFDPDKEKLATKDRRVLRGGAWYDGRMVARAVCRSLSPPGDRFNFPGFRVVVVSPPS
jgi:formylglycine-generating enzyme required for sulfatase activity